MLLGSIKTEYHSFQSTSKSYDFKKRTQNNLHSERMKTAKLTNLSGSGSFQKHKLTGLLCNKSNGQSTVIVFEMQSELHSSVTKVQLTEEYDLL